MKELHSHSFKDHGKASILGSAATRGASENPYLRWSLMCVFCLTFFKVSEEHLLGLGEREEGPAFSSSIHTSVASDLPHRPGQRSRTQGLAPQI